MKKQKEHIPLWGIISIGGVVFVLVILAMSSMSRHNPIKHSTQHFIYQINEFQETRNSIDDEDKYMIDSREVRKWEYDEERPKYLEKIAENKRKEIEKSRIEAVKRYAEQVKWEADQAIKKLEKNRSDKFNNSFGMWRGQHLEIENELKNKLRDPDSYEHIETRYSKTPNSNGNHMVVTKFRAKNGFGGYMTQYATGYINSEGVLVGVVSISN